MGFDSVKFDKLSESLCAWVGVFKDDDKVKIAKWLLGYA